MDEGAELSPDTIAAGDLKKYQLYLYSHSFSYNFGVFLYPLE